MASFTRSARHQRARCRIGEWWSTARRMVLAKWGGGGLGGSESRKDGKTIRYSTYILTQYSREVKNRNKINRLDVHPLSLSRSSDRITKGFSLSHRIIYNTGRVSQPVCESFSHCTHTHTDRHTNTRRSNKCRMRGQITIFKDPYMVNW
jgi:hypothetical protein